jgi:protein O-mannosyl-transferase
VRFTHALLFCLFGALSLALYFPALRGEFIMDDWGYITQNLWVTGAASPWQFWTTFQQTDYWPLTYTLYWLLFKLFGENPLGYHLINLAVHAFNGVLLFLLARRFSVQWPLWVALLFLVHPVHVQSVAWIVQLKTLLSTSLALLTLLAFCRYTQGDGRRWFLISLSAYALAILAKTSVISIPVIMIGMVWQKSRLEWLRLMPFFILSLLGGAVTLHVNSVNFIERQADVFHMNLGEQILVVIQNLVFYPKMFFAPINLSYMYPLRVPETYGPGLFLLAAGFLCLVLVLAVAFYRPWREYRFSIFSYLALLFPCLGFVAIPNMKLSLVADHWAYLPNIFMAIFLGLLIRIPNRRVWKVAIFMPLVLLSALTFRHATTFASEEAFWIRAREVNPKSAAPYYNLGVVYGRKDRVEESIDFYKLTLQRDATHYRAWFNLGRAYFIKAEFEKAEECFLKAIKLNQNLVSGYLALASTYEKVGSQEKAVEALEIGLQANPGDPELAARLEKFKN